MRFFMGIILFTFHKIGVNKDHMYFKDFFITQNLKWYQFCFSVQSLCRYSVDIA